MDAVKCSKDLMSLLDLGQYHACLTGDCPHNKAQDCLNELQIYIKDICTSVKILRRAINTLSIDMHNTSARPCKTCQDITDILGKDFGCVVFINRKKNRVAQKEKHWCMCPGGALTTVARDMFSTCGTCGGQDAYGTCSSRPKDKRKEPINLKD